MTVPKLVAWGRWRWLGGLVALGALQAVAAGAAAFATRDLFAALHSAHADPPWRAVATLASAGAAIAGLRLTQRAVAERLGHDYANALRRNLYRHIARLPASAASMRRVGGLGLRFVGDLSAARLWLSQGLARLLIAALVIPGAGVVLHLIDPVLAGAALSPIVVGVAVMAVASIALQPLHRQLRRRRAGLAIDAIERVSMAAALDLAGRTDREVRRISRRGAEIRRAAVRRAALAALLTAILDLAVVVAGIAIFLRAFDEGSTPANVAAGLAILAILAQPVRDMSGVWDRFCAWRVARSKCAGLFATPTAPRRAAKSAQVLDAPPRLVIDRLTAPPIASFTASASPGEKVAVVGANGTGKSTLLRLAAGLDVPERGGVQLTAAGEPCDFAGVRVAFLAPEPLIVQGSLRRSLSLTLPRRPNDAALLDAARAYGLGRALDRLGGLDGRVAEGGRNLSWGDRRRLQLVQCALGDPQLLLMDDPTAGVDDVGRDLVAKLIRESRATTLIGTMDPIIIRLCDRVWRLDPGSCDGCESPLAARAVGAEAERA